MSFDRLPLYANSARKIRQTINLDSIAGTPCMEKSTNENSKPLKFRWKDYSKALRIFYLIGTPIEGLFVILFFLSLHNPPLSIQYFLKPWDKILSHPFVTLP